MKVAEDPTNLPAIPQGDDVTAEPAEATTNDEQLNDDMTCETGVVTMDS
jgi:hypothetical protein